MVAPSQPAVQRETYATDLSDAQWEQIRPYVEAGFTHLVFHGPGNNQTRFTNAYARDILPRLRERFG